jgi:hypothetical protein
MKVLHLLHALLADQYYRRAMRENLHPNHPDIPRVVLRRQQLADKIKRLTTNVVQE